MQKVSESATQALVGASEPKSLALGLVTPSLKATLSKPQGLYKTIKPSKLAREGKLGFVHPSQACSKPPKAFPKRRGQKDQGLGTETRGSVAEILRKLKLQEGATSSRSPPGSGLLSTGRPEPFSRKKSTAVGMVCSSQKGSETVRCKKQGFHFQELKNQHRGVESPQWSRHPLMKTGNG